VSGVLFVFLDGVGLGVSDASVNPFVLADTPFLESVLASKLTNQCEAVCSDDFLFKPLDACLNYDGLPQSATGQTALLTGQNAAEIMQGHYGPWPGPSLKKELDKGTLFTQCLALGKSAQLVHVYPPGFFKALELKKQKMNVPVYAAVQAALALKTLDDYDKAISVDLTGEYLERYGDFKRLSPFDMGKKLSLIAQDSAFSFFDYWPSDAVGHRASFEDAVDLIEKLDSFLAGVKENLTETTLVICSDHGNLEDKSIKTHTRADVPLLVFGEGARSFGAATSIMDVAAPMMKLIESLG